MAYVFKQIQDAMGRRPGGLQKENIFDPTQSQSAQAAGDMSGAPGQDGKVKTSTEGELASAGGSGTEQSSEGVPGDVKANDQRIVRKNKMGVPGFTTSIGDSLSAAEKGVQDEANAYVAKAQATDFKIAEADLEKGIGGDQAASSVITNRLSEMAKPVDAFDAKTDYSIEDANELRTDEGVKGLLRRSAGANYNAGESAFDMMLLNRTPEFSQIRSSLTGRQDGLTKQVDEYRGSKTKDAQTAIEANLAAGKEQVRGYLGSQGTSLTAAQESEMAVENKALAELRKKGNPALVSAESKKVLAKMLADNAGKDQYGDAGYLDDAGNSVDASKFYNVRGDYSGYDDFIDEKEAVRFNQINALLGKTDGNWAAGKGAGARDSFNREGYGGGIEDGAKKLNAKADAGAQREIDRLLAEYAARDKGRVDLARNLGMGNIESEFDGGYGVDRAAFFTDPGAFAGMSAQEAERLNRQSQELGKGNTYGAGSGYGNSFNADGYRQELQEARDAHLAGIPPPPEPDAPHSTTQLDQKTGGNIGNAKNEIDRLTTMADQDSGGNVAGAKNGIKSWCFPAGIRFLMADGSSKAVELLCVGDEMDGGTKVTHLHTGDSDHLFIYDTALVTGFHPVMEPGGRWSYACNAPGVRRVPGAFTVYSATTENHLMVHEGGTVFGDYEMDDILTKDGYEL